MKYNKKRFFYIMICLCMLCTLSACKASKKKVLESEYYKELEKKYNKQKKENAKLEKKLKKKDEPSDSEIRAKNYLGKISRDSIVKLEIGHHENMEGSDFIDHKIAFTLATQIAQKADLTSKYTAKQIRDKLECVYQYVLYDEDNAVYEILVYDGDYVIFTDMPNAVYYCYNASVLGDAFLHYQHGYPDSKLFHRLADSALIVQSEDKYFEKQTAQKVGILINEMDKTTTSEKDAVKYWKEKAEKEQTKYSRPKGDKYTFYHHGNKLKMTLYDEFFSIRNMDDTVKWYQADQGALNRLKEVLK